jgi:FKBP-type peptidyl-prolyl cis-trans isomerase
MSINNFLKLPIVKIIAMVAMLYYIYDKTKEDPRAISYHLTKENISKSVENVKNSFETISTASQQLKDAQKLVNEASEAKKLNLLYRTIREGNGGAKVVCGSEVSIEYDLINIENDEVINKSNMKFDIGTKFNELIEKALIGMTAGGIRSVEIPVDFKTGDSVYDEMIQKSGMVYKISLLSVSENAKNNLTCDE